MPGSSEQYLIHNLGSITQRLIQFASIPSVSADRACAGEVRRAAEWVAGRFVEAGLERVTRFETGCHPIVYAEWLHAAGKPTLLIYGHYDVQPPDPLEQWESPPFQPEIREGRLFGRGVSDDKGPLLTAIEAAAACLKTGRGLPVNVKFLVEGEEEIGSPSVEAFIRNHTRLLACDFVLSADGAQWRPDEPSVITASRGMAALELSVYGAKKDLHSGRHGGGVANPLQALAGLLSSLRTPEGRVLVHGFYDQVRTLTEEEREEIRGIPFDEEAYLAELGAPKGFGEPGFTLLERQWARPTLDVIGMGGGYQGEGIKTVIPCAVFAKISSRLVPDQDPGDIQVKICQHLEQRCPPGVRLEIKPAGEGVPAYRVPVDHPGMVTARQVLEEIYQRKPLAVRIGATLPIAEAFKRLLGAETIFFSFSTADEDFHAPNEFFRLSRLETGLRAWVRYFEHLGQTSSRQSSGLTE